MVIANSDSMALEQLMLTKTAYRIKYTSIFGIDGTDEGLEAVQKGKITTVYNDKEGQAKVQWQSLSSQQSPERNGGYQFENNRCIYLA